ncbi:organic cation transporter-like protein [Nasonia vitripennis]|uniref:Major facilitator superfamily (MFS) profile domain-containing protein n=1 Tax=Nasonia vitripennis TaxID=7425 RepID=A0A7M7G9K1_NASVI|nr:organic cation transporter-like protein [Nasonia vitripennis]XP_016839569.1 organic cation transporter-like protein [Nasonia vitripennis]XP_032456973.1 organic cation transporter-like protein [Nasonia vitripennis]XP_032456974.1 organic cation transporter-like protein [Nasonia vitripennis]
MQDIESFGKYQLTIYGLITLPLILSAGFTLDFVFTAGPVDLRCAVPECENPSNASFAGPAWLKSSQPDDSSKYCMRYEPANPNIGSTNNDCSDPSFFQNKTIKCDQLIYDPDDLTIMNEWGITCDTQWMLNLVGTINNVGQLVGLTFASPLSDKYGRRTVLAVITFLAGLSGVIHSFAVNYLMFVIFEFIDACFAAGIYSAGFIYAMEMTGVEKRILGSTIISCIFAIGEVWLGLAAMWMRNWRFLMRLIYGPGLLVILLMFILPESVRWLLANDKRDMAEKIYRKMARVNKIDLSEEAFLELKSINSEKPSESEEKKTKQELTQEKKASKEEPTRLMTIFKSPKILVRLMICSFCWFTNNFVYYGLSQNATTLLAGNKYIKFIVVVAIEIPSNILVLPLLNRVGRKATLCGTFILTGVFLLAIEFVPDADHGFLPILALLFYVCAKACITMAFSTSYVYTTELFPTTLRHSLLGICSMTGRLGSILAPQTSLLAKLTYEGVPVLLFGSVTLTAGLLSLTFPETLGTKLPDTLFEAEQIGCDKYKEKAEGNGIAPTSAA